MVQLSHLYTGKTIALTIWTFVSKVMSLFFFFLASPSGSDSKESACNAGDPGLIHGWGRSPGEGNGRPLEYSCLKNSMDTEAWQATVHGVARELDMT